MTHEQKVRAALAFRYAAWFRVCRAVEARLGRPLTDDDYPTCADIDAARGSGRLADEAWPVGPSAPRESYLRLGATIEAAKK